MIYMFEVYISRFLLYVPSKKYWQGYPHLTLSSLKDFLCEHGHEDAIVLETPDYLSAIIGVSDDGRVIYDYEKMVRCLMEIDGMDYEEAIEFIDFNTLGTLPYMGEKRPIILNRIEGEI